MLRLPPHHSKPLHQMLQLFHKVLLLLEQLHQVLPQHLLLFQAIPNHSPFQAQVQVQARELAPAPVLEQVPAEAQEVF